MVTLSIHLESDNHNDTLTDMSHCDSDCQSLSLLHYQSSSSSWNQ